MSSKRTFNRYHQRPERKKARGPVRLVYGQVITPDGLYDPAPYNARDLLSEDGESTEFLGRFRLDCEDHILGPRTLF